MTLTFDARHLARGWLAVALAQAKDKLVPALDRTILIEQHDHGARLTSTDSTVLLTSWVPALDHEHFPPPDLDEAPTFTAVARDPHGRGKAFMRHALHLAVDTERKVYLPPVEVTMWLSEVLVDRTDHAGELTLDGLAPRATALEMPGERLILGCYEGQFPNWRRLAVSFTAESTDRVGLNPDVLGRLAKLDGLIPGTVLGWTFGGPDRAARVEALDQSIPRVEGLVMPCRWDFTADAPRVDQPTDREDTDATQATGAVDDAPSPSTQPGDGDGAEGVAGDGAVVAADTPLRFDPTVAEALRLFADLGELTGGPSNDRQERTIERAAARWLLGEGLIRRVRFDEYLRPVYELTDAGKAVL